MIIATIVALAASAQKNYGRFGRYEQANLELKSQQKNENMVVFMGNSITDFWPRDHKEFFADNGFVGRGIAGQTSFEMLSRFRRDVIELQPRAVVICAGTNDIAQNLHDWYNEDITFGNIVSMAELARANGIEVLLASVPPVTTFGWAPEITDIDKKIGSLNARIRAYADAQGHAYVDYYTALATPEGTMNPAYSTDGVHPNPTGYAVMEGVLLPLLK